MAKKFYEMYGIGTTKYSVHMHDGVQTHQDGSPFYGIALFRNRRKKDQYVRELKRQGYVCITCKKPVNDLEVSAADGAHDHGRIRARQDPEQARGTCRETAMMVYVLEVLDTWDNPVYVFAGVFSTPGARAAFVQRNALLYLKRPDGTDYTIKREWKLSDVELDAPQPLDY